VEGFLKRKKRKNSLNPVVEFRKIFLKKNQIYEVIRNFTTGKGRSKTNNKNMKKLTIILSISALLLTFGSVLAQETPEEVILDEDIQPEDLGVAKPTILPDSPFYLFKNLGRGIQSFFTFNPIAKAELKERFANEKLMELKKLNEESKSAEIIQKATENYQKEIERVREAVEKIKEKAGENEKVGSFLDKFTRHQILHQRVLQKLEEQVPPEAFEKIKATRERHLERFGEVMTKLEENKEKIRERLENNLQKIRGSEFKDFKNIEILKELEEKVPEQTKEAIRKARENTLKRLKTKIEQLSAEKLERFKIYTETISGAKERQAEILENLKERLKEKPALQQKIIESTEGVLKRIEVRKRERTTENTQACIQLWNPVCGKDGKTYSNSCFAKLAEVEIDHKGTCKTLETSTQIKQRIQQELAPRMTP
jgi:hypothetical protein